jgi:hypothetical protein
MDPTVEAALIGIAGTVIGIGGTVIVAISGNRNARRTNQATIDAAQADARLTLEATREAQFADRYSRALEQLGSDNLDVRIGGIYALEGIALDSPRHHPVVMEVLVTFVREHSRAPADAVKPERWPLPDVQAALTVVGRRNPEHDARHMDFSDADLSGANLRGANLKEAELVLVDLSNADLAGANLESATLNAAKLGKANLRGANFSFAKLEGADLSNADLTFAKFDFAYLMGASLVGQSAFPAGFTDAILDGALWSNRYEAPSGYEAAESSEVEGVYRLRQSAIVPTTARIESDEEP